MFIHFISLRSFISLNKIKIHKPKENPDSQKPEADFQHASVTQFVALQSLEGNLT